MKKGLTEIIFILDKSGSMYGLEADTIGGYNSFIEKQKGLEGEALVSTVLFSDNSTVIHDRVPVNQVNPMTEEDYSASGCTALLDAIGDAVHHIVNVHKYARDEDRPEKTIFVITTDGKENSSCRYSYEKIQKMLERQQKEYSWEFLFLGANIDAIGEAAKLGIRRERAVTYECDREGTNLNFATVGQVVATYRCCSAIDDSWKNDIEEYQKTRRNRRR